MENGDEVWRVGGEECRSEKEDGEVCAGQKKVYTKQP